MAIKFSSIRHRVMIALFLLAFAGVVTSIWSISAFMDYQNRLEHMSDADIPTLIAAYELARQGEAIAKTASGVVQTNDRWTRKAFVLRIEEQLQWLDDHLLILHDKGVDEVRLNPIKSNKEALHGSTVALVKAMDKRGDAIENNSNLLEIDGLNAEVERLLLLHKDHAERMTFSVAGLANSVGADIQETVRDTVDDFRVGNWQMVAYGVLTLLFVVLVAYYLDTSVSSRVVRIQQAMRSVADGNTKEAIPRGGEDEVADMADALGTFVEKLNVREKRLKELVSDRTHELAKVNATLEINERRLRNLFEVASDWFFETNRDLRISSMSRQFFDRLDIDEDEIIAQPIIDLMKRNGFRIDPYELEKLKGLIAKHAPFRQIEFSLYLKGKDAVHIEAAGVPVLSEAGEFLGYNGALTDITQSKETEKQLRHAQKMQALGSLAGGVAHSFNNIFQPILLLNEMTLEESPENSPARKRLRIAIEACRRGKELGDRILLYSRQDEPNRLQLNIFELLSSALILFETSAPASIRVVKQLDPDTGEIIGDAAQLEALLLNLATNALDAIGTSAGEIKFSLKRVWQDDVSVEPNHDNENRAYACITVSDDGCGMDADVLERIYDPFFTTKGLGKGTGLGLSMVSGITNMHGGHVKVASTPGQGTTFDIYLPLV